MSDEQQNEKSQATSNAAPQAGPSPFVEEITKLGQNFSQLIKDALASPQLQEMRNEVASGAQGVIEEINDAMVKAREAEITKDVAQKATKTAEDLKASPVTANIKSGLFSALKSINDELSNVLQRMNQGEQPAAPNSDATGPADADDSV